MNSSPPPHFLLYSGASRPSLDPEHGASDGWSFVLRSREGERLFEAFGVEPKMCHERLELLAVVRGLEALDQPSRVTLVTKSRYVSRGLTYGLDSWRENGWRWERFGKMVPVKNRDLWQRVDQALRFHHVECHKWRFDAAHVGAACQGGPKLSAGRSAVAEAAKSASKACGSEQPTKALGWPRRLCEVALSWFAQRSPAASRGA